MSKAISMEQAEAHVEQVKSEIKEFFNKREDKADWGLIFEEFNKFSFVVNIYCNRASSDNDYKILEAEFEVSLYKYDYNKFYLIDRPYKVACCHWSGMKTAVFADLGKALAKIVKSIELGAIERKSYIAKRNEEYAKKRQVVNEITAHGLVVRDSGIYKGEVLIGSLNKERIDIRISDVDISLLFKIGEVVS